MFLRLADVLVHIENLSNIYLPYVIPPTGKHSCSASRLLNEAAKVLARGLSNGTSTIPFPNRNPHHPYPNPPSPPTPTPPPGRVLCTVLVTIPWACPLIEFHSIDNNFVLVISLQKQLSFVAAVWYESHIRTSSLQSCYNDTQQRGTLPVITNTVTTKILKSIEMYPEIIQRPGLRC